MGQIFDHIASIFACKRCLGRPVDRIVNFEKTKFLFSKLLVRQLRHRMTDFGTRLSREIPISCLPCVEAGEADWFYLKKNIGLFNWPINL